MKDTNEIKGFDYVNDVDAYKEYLNMQHSEEFQKLWKFYNRKTIMDILGVARQENPHSSFIKWLLDPSENHGLSDYGFRKFCETVCFAYKKYGKDYIDSPVEILKQSKKIQKPEEAEKYYLFWNPGTDTKDNVDKESWIYTLMKGDFVIKDFFIGREIFVEGEGKKGRRADIWINCKLERKEGPKRFLFLIENKVESKESDGQTQSYIEYISKRLIESAANDKIGDVDYFVPIFLYVATNREMKNAIEGSKKLPCNSTFLVINYQYVLDGVITPCRTYADDALTQSRLDEYVACLGQSIFGQDDEEKDSKKKERDLVMAVSSLEKELAISLWNKHSNILRDIGVHINGEKQKHFAIKSDADKRFYLTILRPIVNILEEKKEQNYEVTQDDNDMIQAVNQVITYRAKSGGKIIEFKAYGGPGENISALTYSLLRQFLCLMNDSSLSIEKIREKLIDNVDGPWYAGFFVTEEEFDDYVARWKKVHNDINAPKPVCKKYIYDSSEDPMKRCPLDETSGTPFSRNCKNIDLKKYIEDNGCPVFQEYKNGQLREFHRRESKRKEKWINEYASSFTPVEIKGLKKNNKGCPCIYSFLHKFYVGNLKTPTEHEIFKNEKSVIDKISINTDYGAVKYKGKNVYISKYSLSDYIPDIYKCLNEMLNKHKPGVKMEDYITYDNNAPDKELNFLMGKANKGQTK